MVRLSPMGPEEFDTYVATLNRDYAAAHVSAGNWPAAGAEARAAESTRRLLPAGERTPGHRLLHVVDATGGERVGFLWYRVEPYRGSTEIFVLDIEILAAFRRRGYARDTLRLLREQALRMGAQRIRLHVFGDNHGARSLYRSFGFEETDVWVAKALGRDAGPREADPAARWSTRPALRLEPIDATAFDAFRADYLESAAAGAAQDASGWGRTPAQARAADARAQADKHLRSTLPLGVRTQGHELARVRHATSGTLVGSLWYGLPTGIHACEAAVHFLHVVEGMRRRGYGQAAIHMVEGRARAAGARRLTAGITAGNVAARAMFAAAGFAEAGLWMALEVPPSGRTPAPGTATSGTPTSGTASG